MQCTCQWTRRLASSPRESGLCRASWPRRSIIDELQDCTQNPWSCGGGGSIPFPHDCYTSLDATYQGFQVDRLHRTVLPEVLANVTSVTAPKGGPYFGVPSARQFWYMDLTGSGSETISHLHEPHNGRITIMFNAFDGPPRIVRLWGYGTVLEFDSPEFTSYIATHDIKTIPGTRSIVVVDIHQVGSSCGFSVPYYDFKEHRPILNNFMAQKEKKFLAGKKEESMDHYWAFKNAYSMDGLPGMKRGLVAAKQYSVAPIKKMVGSLAPKNSKVYTSASALQGGLHGFGILHLVFMMLVGMLVGLGFAVWGPEVQVKMKEVVTPVLEGARTRIGTIHIPSPAQILRR